MPLPGRYGPPPNPPPAPGPTPLPSPGPAPTPVPLPTPPSFPGPLLAAADCVSSATPSRVRVSAGIVAIGATTGAGGSALTIGRCGGAMCTGGVARIGLLI